MNKYDKGFTLIEILIVLIISSLLLTGVLGSYSLFIKQKKLSDLEKIYDMAQQGLRNFILKDPDPLDGFPETNSRYPCPASISAIPFSATYGEEFCPTVGPGACENGVCVVTGTNGPVYIGGLPTKTMGISANNANDPFGNRLTYAVSAGLTLSGSLAGVPISSGAVTIDPTIGGTPITDAHFALISHGEDGAGSYTVDGQINSNTCRVGELGDAENCDGDSIFSELERAAAKGVAYYDDRVAFTLSDGSSDAYWVPVDSNPQNIRNLNETGFVWVGPAPDPTLVPANASLAVRDDVFVTQDVLAGRDISAAGIIRVNANCPTGEVLTGIVDGIAQCQSIAVVLADTFECESGQSLIFDDAGTPVCGTPEGYTEVFSGSSASVTNNWGTGNFIVIGKNPTNSIVSSRTLTIVSTAAVRVASADAGGASVNIAVWDSAGNRFTFSNNNIIRIYHQPLSESP